jgi:hypothetical protein
MKSIYERQNLFFYDGVYNPSAKNGVWAECPILALLADPNLGTVFYEDFVNYVGRNSSTFLGGYVTSLSSSGTMGITDAEDGVLHLDSGGVTAGHGITVQKVGERNALASDKELWLEAKFKVGSVSKANIFIGLAETNSDLMVDGDLDASSEYLGFGVESGGGGSLKLICANGATELSDVVANLTSDTYVRAGIHVDKDLVITAFINDAEVTLTNVVTAYLPDALMKPTFICQSDGSAEQPTLDVDYMKVVQIR